jgi:hypothetical protein
VILLEIAASFTIKTKPMFIHHVYFWLKEGLSQEEIQQFEAGVKSLLSIESVKIGDVGKPAGTDRPVIDTSYSYSLLTIFDNEEGHDIYQPHPVHLKFIESCKHLWTKVLIYDSETV